MDTIYVDNNATTAVAPEVFEALLPYLTEEYFNPSSMYEQARGAAEAIGRARRSICHALSAGSPKQILFTGSATESNNTAIFGTVRANPNRKQIVTTAVEHPAVLEVCKDLERSGYPVSYVPVDRDGNLNLREFVRALTPETLLVSVMFANNETGVIFPVEELSRLTKETDPEIVFHTDATQAVGKLPIDLKGALRHVDLLSFSGHKLHAPKGVGALFIRAGTRCRPTMIGGHQEEGRRAGTENVPYIVGLGAACRLALERMEQDEERVGAMRDRLEQGLQQAISHVQISGKDAPRLANTLNIACHYIEGEGILYQLSSHGICASSGSACTSGSLEPSHVLRAMDVPFTAVHGSIRFSLSRYNTMEEMERIIEVLPPIVRNLRKLSPYWDTKSDAPRPGSEVRSP